MTVFLRHRLLRRHRPEIADHRHEQMRTGLIPGLVVKIAFGTVETAVTWAGGRDRGGFGGP